jgi:cytochrome c oxidase subunit 2
MTQQPPPPPRRLLLVVLAAALPVLTVAASWVGWDWRTVMTTVIPKSDFGWLIQDLFMLISWITIVIFVAVEGLLLLACWLFRERPGAPVPRQTHGHTLLEVGWTIAFAVVLVIIGIPTVQVIFKTQEAPAATALRVDVAGRQWWWEFRYPELGIVTANEVHVPVGQTVAFHLHGPDVIHSFWVPQLGGKRDVVPGRVNRLVLIPQAPGEYLGQCAEYCGTSHANMRFRVVVHAAEDWARWVRAQQAPPAEPAEPLAQRGKELFTQQACVGCHAVRGLSGGTLGPDLTHVGSRKTLAAGLVPLTRENLARWIEQPGAVKPGALMPDLGLRGEQSQALAAYLLSLK